MQQELVHLPPSTRGGGGSHHARAAAELERPVLLFSGGKDSIVLLWLAEKAFRPGKFPFPVMHVDTGHNFPR
jgi:3'-phosphoadenosine 5'-phosphosulfate sulfotransferase (PAPS reductase)/FAD synthetase